MKYSTSRHRKKKQNKASKSLLLCQTILNNFGHKTKLTTFEISPELKPACLEVYHFGELLFRILDGKDKHLEIWMIVGLPEKEQEIFDGLTKSRQDEFYKKVEEKLKQIGLYGLLWKGKKDTHFIVMTKFKVSGDIQEAGKKLNETIEETKRKVAKVFSVYQTLFEMQFDNQGYA